MEDNHQQRFFLRKVSRLFPSSLSSCHFRSLPDVVAESSITVPKKSNHQTDLSSSFKTPPAKFSNQITKQNSRYKCPPVTPISNRNIKVKKFQERNKRTGVPYSVPHSSSANSGWFSSSDEKSRRRKKTETDTFFSFSSNSGDSFRHNTGQRFKKCEEMKSIDETGRFSFSSNTSLDTLLTKASKNVFNKNRVLKSSKIFPEYELGSDRISAHVYYSSNRRRKTEKTRRKMRRKKKEGNESSMVTEKSYAIEKRSNDPRGDFRASMVEMILAKQMFGEADLERLLHCFLSLNDVSYHGMILDIFSEICETLFSQ